MRTRLLYCLISALFLIGCQSQAAGVASPENELVPKFTDIPLVVPTKIPQSSTIPSPTPLSTVTPTPVKPPAEWILWNDSPHKTARQSVECKTCHATSTEGVSPSLAWFDPAAGSYESIAESQTLCNKCHQSTEQEVHLVDLTDVVHTNLSCLNCHNPHSTSASCTNSGCHSDLLKGRAVPLATPIDGHQYTGDAICGGESCHPAATQAAYADPTIHGSRHARVACFVCHAAGEIKIERSERTGAFSVVTGSGGNTTPLVFSPVFHSVSRQVDCTRCHFDGNQWDLPLVSSDKFGQ